MIKAEPVVFLSVKAYGAVVAALNDVPGDPPARLSRPAGALLEINLILLSTDTIQHARKIVVCPLLFFIKQRLKEERIPNKALRCGRGAFVDPFHQRFHNLSAKHGACPSGSCW